ncbi:MAG: SIS domain-containing protein [Candidatus Kerfeldbacteria bacterium]|nr:SIS domain-containing protein [Candidatus Kerfeldbacteria bacterium]
MTGAQLDRHQLLRRDPGLVGLSLSRLADQLRDGWHQAKPPRLPAGYRTVRSIAVCGMGGSHLGADILRSALADRLRVPVTIVADYRLPKWVDQSTLVICSSYSGTTEETLTAFRQALKRRAKVIAVTHGGALARLAKQAGVPVYQYDDKENPSGQPRLGVAYGMMAMLEALRKLKLVRIDEREIAQLPVIAWEATKRFWPARTASRNLAKQLALAWSGRIPFLVGAEWSAGNVHTFVNQLHENAKTYADFRLLPDLNHHLLEGMRNRTVTKQFSFLLINDRSYINRTQRRFVLSANILKRLGADIQTYQPHGATALEKAIDLLAFGGYVSWYLAAVRKVKPALIPTVDALKAALAK